MLAANLLPDASLRRRRMSRPSPLFAHRLVEEFLAALPIRVLQQVPGKRDLMNDQMRLADLLREACGLLVGLPTGS